MTELITVHYENERPTVSGRDLHDRLGIATQYTKWFERMAEYGFVENEDYAAISQKRLTAQGNETTFIDHQLTIDMAKQICMIQRTDTGRRYREYFLDVERRWNAPESVMARALQMANRQLADVTGQLDAAHAQLAEAEPKVIFADAVSTAKTSILVGDLAKLLRQNGVKIGQKRLFEWLRNNGYLMKTGESYNMPTQKSMERGLFEIKEGTYINPDGSVRVTKTTKVTGKGQQYFINLFLEKQSEKQRRDGNAE